MSQFTVHWVDSGRMPKCLPDLRYPNGIALDCSNGTRPACLVKLPCPAKRCGHYVIECQKCGLSVVSTTAGRFDDPCSILLACLGPGRMGRTAIREFTPAVTYKWGSDLPRDSKQLKFKHI